MLALFSATLSPGFCWYTCKSCSSVSTQFLTSYTAEVVFSYLNRPEWNENLQEIHGFTPSNHKIRADPNLWSLCSKWKRSHDDILLLLILCYRHILTLIALPHPFLQFWSEPEPKLREREREYLKVDKKKLLKIMVVRLSQGNFLWL